MKCKTFDAGSAAQLDDLVNEFLSENENITIVDSFYNTTHVGVQQEMPQGLQAAGKMNVDFLFIHSLTLLYTE